MRRFALFLLTASAVFAQNTDIAGECIRPHVKFVARDLLEGRGVGTRGERLATEYIATQFALIGAKPAGDRGTYFQRVPMVGATTQSSATLSATNGAKTIPFQWLNEFVGVSELQQPVDQFDAEAVFVGHGITAPEFQWDDFKGTDVKGKEVILLKLRPSDS